MRVEKVRRLREEGRLHNKEHVARGIYMRVRVQGCLHRKII